MVGAQLTGGAQVVESDKAANPAQVRVFGSRGIVLQTDCLANRLQQLPVLDFKPARLVDLCLLHTVTCRRHRTGVELKNVPIKDPERLPCLINPPFIDTGCGKVRNNCANITGRPGTQSSLIKTALRKHLRKTRPRAIDVLIHSGHYCTTLTGERY
jgi:hypothetical protein